MSAARMRARVEVCRDEMTMHAAILEALGDDERTVPELAAALGQPVQEVMVWVMGMRRYGLLRESAAPNDEDYYAYRAVKPPAASAGHAAPANEESRS
jgi:hypothetical protein